MTGKAVESVIENGLKIERFLAARPHAIQDRPSCLQSMFVLLAHSGSQWSQLKPRLSANRLAQAQLARVK
jgi:hypothetical protein